jgi:hypothetical protein
MDPEVQQKSAQGDQEKGPYQLPKIFTEHVNLPGGRCPPQVSLLKTGARRQRRTPIQPI